MDPSVSAVLIGLDFADNFEFNIMAFVIDARETFSTGGVGAGLTSSSAMVVARVILFEELKRRLVIFLETGVVEVEVDVDEGFD